MDKIFFKGTKFIQAEYNNKWKITDKRRIIFYVEFNNGGVWYPKDNEIKLLNEAMLFCFDNNIKYKNLDKEEEQKCQT